MSGDRVAVHDRRPVHHDHRRRQHRRRDRLSTTDGVGRLVAGLLAVARAVVDHRPGHPQHPRTEGDRPDRVGGGAQRLPGEGPRRRRGRGTHADVHLVRTIRIIQACRADLRDVAGQGWHSQPAALGEPRVRRESELPGGAHANRHARRQRDTGLLVARECLLVVDGRRCAAAPQRGSAIGKHRIEVSADPRSWRHRTVVLAGVGGHQRNRACEKCERSCELHGAPMVAGVKQSVLS